MAEVTVVERTRQQAGRLKQLRQRLKVRKSDIISRLGWDSTQTYDLYERGVSIIRMDRVDDWAAAFGIDPLDFAAVVLGARPVEDVLTTRTPPTGAADWDMATDLRGHVPESDIPGFVAEHGGKSIEDQRAISESIKRQTHRAQRKATRRRNRPA